MKTSWLILHKHIIAVCCENDTKHVHKMHPQNAQILNVKVGGPAYR
jgi:hypothetical protein